MEGEVPGPETDIRPGRTRPSRVVLLGNPNVGKSALFNALTGLRTTVSNYPGTTVEVARGRVTREGGDVEVIDSPGVNSIVPVSEDEEVTWKLLHEVRRDEDAVVLQVADAKNLRRALLLTLQLGHLEVPTVLALNMSDEAEARGIAVDIPGLAAALGIPVHATVATRGVGVAELSRSLSDARPPTNHVPLPAEAAAALGVLEGRTQPPEGGSTAVVRYHEALLAESGRLSARFLRGHGRATTGSAFARRLSHIAVHPFWGWPVLAAILYAVYEIVGVFGAGTLVDLLEKGLFHTYLNPWATAAFSHVPIPFVRDLFAGEYGLITMGLSYGLAIVLPIVTTFFAVFALLEDSGYLPRLAVMSDRAFRLLGLNGKAVLPMILGLGCDTMATLTTRILETKKERVLATLLLALGVPCSAQLGVILAMLAAVPASAGLVWGISLLAVMMTVGFIAARLVPGERGEFIVELPPFRRPQLSNVVAKTAARVEWYLREALPLFLIGTLCLFLLDRFHLLGTVIRVGEPLVSGLLGLPKEASEAFLIGFLRRDFGATRLFDMARDGQLTVIQLVVSMVTITLFIPCIANVFIIAKERGAKTAAAIVGTVFPIAFLTGGLVRVTMCGLGLWGAR